MAAAAFAAAASAGASSAPSATSDEDVRHLRETILKLEAQVKALTDVAYGESFRLDDGSHGRHAAHAPHGSAAHGDDGSIAPRESSASPDSERLAPMWSSVPAELMSMSDGASSTGGMMASPTLRPMKTAFKDGTTVSVRPDETAVMKAVFDMLDENKDGTVAKTELQVRPWLACVCARFALLSQRAGDAAGLGNWRVIASGQAFGCNADRLSCLCCAQELHRRLGEHVEEDELDAALKATGADGDTVDFPTFMRLWQGSFAVFYEDTVESEALEKKRQRYQARFQMLKARVANPEVGRITTRPSGTPGTLGYRVHFFYRNSDGTEKQISPWHDIPLRNPDTSYNFICEIPKWTRAKFEIATDEPFNPIKQDTRNGVLRDYKWVS